MPVVIALRRRCSNTLHTPFVISFRWCEKRWVGCRSAEVWGNIWWANVCSCLFRSNYLTWRITSWNGIHFCPYKCFYLHDTFSCKFVFVLWCRLRLMELFRFPNRVVTQSVISSYSWAFIGNYHEETFRWHQSVESIAHQEEYNVAFTHKKGCCGFPLR